MSRVLNAVVPLGLLLVACGAQDFFRPNVTLLEKLLSKYQQDGPHARVRRAIPRSDREEILLLHNKLRGQVHPPASNMEYMVSAVLPGSGRGVLASESPLPVLSTVRSPCRGAPPPPRGQP